MIRAVQTVGWSLLAADPVPIEDGVIALLGKNGSGKSSLLDAIKAVMGARRFGQNRSAATYRYAGRSGAPAARTAYVLCLIDNGPRGARRLDSDSDEVTLVLESGPSQRRFLALSGDRLLPTGATLAGALQQMRSERPRSEWMRPAEYERRVLDRIGIGPAVRRLMELPQGEIGRALDSDPRALVGLLVELAGGRDASEAFTRAQRALADAREKHAEARRRVDRRRAALAEQRLAAQAADAARERRTQLAALRFELEAALETMGEEDAPATTPPRCELSPPSQETGIVDRQALQRAGVDLELHEGVLCVAAEHRDRARALLAPGESIPVAGDALPFLLRSEALLRGEPRTITSPVAAEVQREQTPADGRLRTSVRDALAKLTAAGVNVQEPQDPLGSDPAGLLGAYRALTAGGIPTTPRGRDLEELAQAAATLSAEQQDLEARAETLSEASARLGEARTAYQQAVQRALADAAECFGALCDDAGLRGGMRVLDGPDGPQVEIHAAESPGEEPRPLWGSQASLSGGWRVTVVVLALLACLYGGHGLPVLCLDEVGGSLDEQRLTALGRAFARLAERRGLQTIMTLPTGALSEVVAEFADQQIGFVRPLPDEPLAPPPHIVSLRDRALRAA